MEKASQLGRGRRNDQAKSQKGKGRGMYRTTNQGMGEATVFERRPGKGGFCGGLTDQVL